VCSSDLLSAANLTGARAWHPMRGWAGVDENRLIRISYEGSRTMKLQTAIGSAIAFAFVAGAFAQVPLAPNTYKAGDPPKYTGKTVVTTNVANRGEPKCPLSVKPINKEYAVDFDGGKVYMCCEDCPAAFKKDEAKYAAKAHLQMVQTGQLKQVACPFLGNKVDPSKTIEVEGVMVAFCLRRLPGEGEEGEMG